MKTYIGTKLIQAEPMTRGAYNEYRGWQIPADENPEDTGYLVKYSDDYVSWSPAGVFEEVYRPMEDMTFGLAIEMLKRGHALARKGWNGKHQFIEIASNISYESPTLKRKDCEHEAIGNKAIAFVGTSGIQLGWFASQADMLAEDWYIVA